MVPSSASRAAAPSSSGSSRNLPSHIQTSAAPTPPIQWDGQSLRAPKSFRTGMHRTVTPAETLARVRGHLARIGATRVADITGLDRIGIPVTLVHRPNSPTLANATGKGITLEAATVSGVMEALEIWHGERVAAETRRASWAEIEAEDGTICWKDLPLFRHALFSPSRPARWVRAWDVARGRAAWVPWRLVSMTPHPEDALRLVSSLQPFVPGSNGLASGNHLLEAVVAGLLEVIERDAITCWKVAGGGARRRPPRRGLDGVADPEARELLAHFSAADVDVEILDATVDTGIPVRWVHLHDARDSRVGSFAGYGAHLDPGVALCRALTEAAQSRLVTIAGSRDDLRRDVLQGRLEHTAPAGTGGRSPGGGAERFAGATDTFEGDLRLILDALASIGLKRVLVVDLTRDEVGVPVVRVVVPGLEGYPFRHSAPGHRARRFAGREMDSRLHWVHGERAEHRS